MAIIPRLLQIHLPFRFDSGSNSFGDFIQAWRASGARAPVPWNESSRGRVISRFTVVFSYAGQASRSLAAQFPFLDGFFAQFGLALHSLGFQVHILLLIISSDDINLNQHLSQQNYHCYTFPLSLHSSFYKIIIA